MSKCNTCKVNKAVMESDVPACCKWFMDHVVILGESVENCTEYEQEDSNES